ncbi:hypothetical protein E2C01_010098 [Portunus trituberculatus]|uniref:Uncharacterized protein n=1 Tax=Portunus trituberculatus TaxID=210409 RepID=A0A5B7D7H4_PORTR|nr:hypothetical protein [Portunus trituberculatus]
MGKEKSRILAVSPRRSGIRETADATPNKERWIQVNSSAKRIPLERKRKEVTIPRFIGKRKRMTSHLPRRTEDRALAHQDQDRDLNLILKRLTQV